MALTRQHFETKEAGYTFIPLKVKLKLKKTQQQKTLRKKDNVFYVVH